MQNNGESPKLPRLDGRSLTNRERECLKGDSPGEIAPEGSLGLGSDDSGLGSGRRKFGNLIANFGGWQKNLSVARQLFHIVCIAIAGLIAFGVLVDGLTGLSKMLSLP